MKYNILVTGADGFVGQKLTRVLSGEFNVKAIVRDRKFSASSLKPSVVGDITEIVDWGPHLKNINTVIHLAGIAHNRASDSDHIKKVNVTASIHLAMKAAESNVKRFIFISSISVLGDKTQKPFNEVSSLSPQSYVAECKCQVEKALLEISKSSDMEVVIIRPALVYGENAPGNIKKLTQMINKFPILPFALCNNKRSFISLSNLVDFISVCIKHPKAANEVFCISDGVDVSIQEFTDGIASGLNKTLIQLPVPMFIFKIIGKLTGKMKLVDQLIGDLQVDSNKAKSLLGWKPPVTMADTFLKLKRIK